MAPSVFFPGFVNPTGVAFMVKVRDVPSLFFFPPM